MARGDWVFFILTATSLTLYTSSLQLFFSNHMLAGIATFFGGVLVTLSQKFSADKSSKRGQVSKSVKGVKKVCGSLDFLPDCNCDCPDCGGCDC